MRVRHWGKLGRKHKKPNFRYAICHLLTNVCEPSPRSPIATESHRCGSGSRVPEHAFCLPRPILKLRSAFYLCRWFSSSEEQPAHRTTQPCVLCLSSLDQRNGFVVRFIYTGRVVGSLCFITERSHSKNTPQFTYSFTHRCWSYSQFGLFWKPLRTQYGSVCGHRMDLYYIKFLRCACIMRIFRNPVVLGLFLLR